jgi:hypothetical protein
MSVGDGRVHVLFRDRRDEYAGYWMTTETYHAIGLLTPATPDDFRRHGPLVEAPAEFEGGRRTKRVG